MRNLIAAGISILIVLGVPATSMAEAMIKASLNGNTLYATCTGNDSDRQFCLGYVLGISDAMESYQSGTGVNFGGSKACVPVGVVFEQQRDVVTNWLREHPEARHYGAPGLVKKALSEGFPCKR
jgi:hypothetical protein